VFDCSDLTMESWLAAGVPIPRVADSQYVGEPHVALADLVDGDLVFYASGKTPTSIYHVGLYLGGGYMVDAPRTGQVVQSAPIATPQLVAEGAAP
jgi:cell wall-associated NlpC family hydrolase